MRHNLPGKTALHIEYKRNASDLVKSKGDPAAIPAMTMQNIRLGAANLPPCEEKQHHREIELLVTRPGISFLIPGDFGDTMGRDSRHITPDVIGTQFKLVAQPN